MSHTYESYLLSAAGDTTATNMQNVLFACAKYPKIQEKVVDELKEKNFDISAIEEAPYLRAIIAECKFTTTHCL